MPRPLRLEFKDAFYHVMNRGRGRQAIFHGHEYYHAFLDCLAQAHERFGAEVSAYCLMGNHYHLLIKTPLANLSRVMRHINGVYTQRYNRLKHTDGPLFRGRYKAIVVDADAYLLQVTRYIHRNPIETKSPLVKVLEHYPWSSYPAYLGKTAAPAWLQRELAYRMLGKRERYAGYKAFTEQGVDDETQQFYSKGHLAAVMGDPTFRERLLEKAARQDGIKTAVAVRGRPSIGRIVKATAKAYKVTVASIAQPQPGIKQANRPRKYAMYIGQQAGYRLKELAGAFAVAHVGTISHALTQVRQQLEEDTRLAKQLEQVRRGLW